MLLTSLKISDPGSALLWVLKCCALMLAYFVAGKLGLLLPAIGSHITLIWLPTGIAVAGLLRWNYTLWPAVYLASLAVNVNNDSPLILAMCIAVGNTLGPLLTYLILKHTFFNWMLDKSRDIFMLIVAAALGMAVSASGGVFSLYIFNAVTEDQVMLSWFTWWAGDFVGVLLAAPLLLNISFGEIKTLWKQRIEYALWLGLASLLGWVIFFVNRVGTESALPLVFLMVPMVVWSAMRFENTGASISTLVCMFIAALATSRGLGPFHRDESYTGLFVMWVFLATLVLVQLMVTALQTQRKVAEDRIHTLAFFDPLTHLPNRNLLLDRLRQAINISTRNKHHGAVMFLDLDHFKNINDSYGHDAGDYLLKEVARRLLVCVRQGDTVSRLSGDEFVVVLENLDEDSHKAAKQAESIAEKIRSSLADVFHLTVGQYQQHKVIDYFTSASIGITLFRDSGEKLDELLKRADLTMYQAKSAGRNTVRFFDPAMQRQVEHRAELETHLRYAVDRHELKIAYQLQVDQYGNALGCEALLRWNNAKNGLISPAEFIPLAEHTGLILPIGGWVLNQACQQLSLWAEKTETREISIAINVSARQFREADFVTLIETALKRYAVTPYLLKLELTEGVVLYDIDEAVAKMHQLKNLGVTLSLDDFGTGYSSLSYLQRLPLDQLKIDQSFVRDLTQDTSDAAIVRTIISLGETLGLDVIAEGVENQEQYAYLVSHGCKAFQGYLFARPEPVEKLEILLLRKMELKESAIT